MSMVMTYYEHTILTASVPSSLISLIRLPGSGECVVLSLGEYMLFIDYRIGLVCNFGCRT